jgi:hypothetical protein
MLPPVSARTTIAKHKINANVSRRRTGRALVGGKQNDIWREKLRLPFSKWGLKAIPALL